jgi:hypothetical protein
LIVAAGASLANAPLTLGTGIFGGAGTVGNITANTGAVFSPGENTSEELSIATLHTGSLNLIGDTTFSMGIGASADRIDVTGTVTVAQFKQCQLSLNVTSNFNASQGDIFFLLLNDGIDPIVGDFNYAEGQDISVAGNLFRFTRLAESTANGGLGSFTGGNDLAVKVVPEPIGSFLLGVGLIGVFALRRRSRGSV